MSKSTSRKLRKQRQREPEPSTADVLVSIGMGDELFHDEDGVGYATVGVKHADGSEHKENFPIRSKGYKRSIQARYLDQTDRAASGEALTDATNILDALAVNRGPLCQIATRIGHSNGDCYLDLCDATGRCVRIGPEGWEVIENAPIKFIRRAGMQALPTPVHGGKLDELRPLLNAEDDSDWILAIAWLVGVFMVSGPYPVLVVNGEQGSAKSTFCRMLRKLIDPNKADLRSLPREERDMVISAKNSRILGFDNISNINPWQSDALCRISTGSGYATRKLYSDDEEQLFSGSLPIITNGIGDFIDRPDLAERGIIIRLTPIPDEQRRSERALWRVFDEVRPRVLGALLDAVVVALRNIEEVKVPGLPRMADFARWIVAAETKLPWEPGEFMSVYGGNRRDAENSALESSILGPYIVRLVSEGGGAWSGTSAELMSAVDRMASEADRRRLGWPKSARGYSSALDRVAPALRRSAGISIERAIVGHDRKKTINMRQAPEV